MKLNLYIVLFFTSLLGLTLSLSSCTKDEVDTTGSIFGKVTNSQINEPVNGATITITPGGKSTTTGSNGSFEFQDIAPGQYEIQVTKPDFATNTKRITVVAGESASGDIAITPTTQKAKVELSTPSLNFGKGTTSLTFDIKNVGNIKFNWNITGLEKVDWLTPSPTSGSIEPGRSNAVVLTLHRDKLSKNNEAVLLIQADKESVSLRVTAETESTATKIELSTTALDFGKEHTSLTFSIRNVGNAGFIDWTIPETEADWFTVSPLKGSTDMGKSSAVKVELDRTKIKGKLTTQIMVYAAGESLPLTISAEEKTSGGGEEEGGGDLDPENIISCDDGIKVSVISCKRNGSTLVLTYMLNNTGMGKDLDNFYIHPNNPNNKNSFSDNLGNSYTATLVWAGKTGTNQTLFAPLPKNTPKQGTITIKDFSSEAKGVTCQIYCAPPASYTLASNWITFKNIEIK